RHLTQSYLHSFPTRRSSDLPELAKSIRRVDVIANSNFGFRRRFRLFSKNLGPSDWTETQYDVHARFWRSEPRQNEQLWTLKDARSEEHTSKLQSRFDLVCRL